MGKRKSSRKGNGTTFLWFVAILVVIAAIGRGGSNSDKKVPTATTTAATQTTVAETTPTETIPPETTEATTEPTTYPTTAETEAPTQPEVTEPEKHIANRGTKKYHELWCDYAPESGSKNYWMTDASEDLLESWGYTHCARCG